MAREEWKGRQGMGVILRISCSLGGLLVWEFLCRVFCMRQWSGEEGGGERSRDECLNTIVEYHVLKCNALKEICQGQIMKVYVHREKCLWFMQL